MSAQQIPEHAPPSRSGVRRLNTRRLGVAAASVAAAGAGLLVANPPSALATNGSYCVSTFVVTGGSCKGPWHHMESAFGRTVYSHVYACTDIWRNPFGSYTYDSCGTSWAGVTGIPSSWGYARTWPRTTDHVAGIETWGHNG
jgi:hypothetical protein